MTEFVLKIMKPVETKHVICRMPEGLTTFPAGLVTFQHYSLAQMAVHDQTQTSNQC